MWQTKKWKNNYFKNYFENKIILKNCKKNQWMFYLVQFFSVRMTRYSYARVNLF